MKTSGSQVGGELKGEPDGPYHEAWALYYSKFLSQYRDLHGVHFWAITAQNEPTMSGKSTPVSTA